MTTYELPPEPPIGESVQDALGRTWKHEGDRWALKDDADGPDTRSWRQLFLSAPLTLIEPDPWPTEPLIVADWTESAGKSGRGLLYKDDSGDYCPTIDEEVGIVRDYRRDALTNVVPVTVVPVAGLDALRASIKALGYGPQDTRGMTGSLLDTALRLLDATDALGVDL